MAGMAVYSLCAADGLRHYSPHVWKVILGLKHKGLDFDLRPVSFADIPQIAGGGFSCVPVLDDHGRLEGDSFGIALYLEQAYSGKSLFPHDGQHALARMIEYFCDTVLNPPLSVIVVRQMHDMMPLPIRNIFERCGKNASMRGSRKLRSVPREKQIDSHKNLHRFGQFCEIRNGLRAMCLRLPIISCSEACSGTVFAQVHLFFLSKIRLSSGFSVVSSITALSYRSKRPTILDAYDRWEVGQQVLCS